MEQQIKGRARPSVVAIVAVIAFLFFFWQAFAYFGFVGGLAEWQFGEIGTYFPAMTITILVGLLALLAWVIAKLIRRRKGGEEEAVQILVQKQLNAAARMTRALFALTGLALAGALISALIFFFGLPDGSPPAQTLDASQSQASKPKEGLTVLRGVPNLQRIGRFRESILIRDRVIYFAPVSSAGAKAPVQYFVQVKRIDDVPERYEPVRAGVLRRSGLPKEVAAMYRGAGIPVVDDHYVLYESSASIGWRYQTLALQFLGFSLICLIFALFQRRLWRKTEEKVREAQGQA